MNRQDRRVTRASFRVESLEGRVVLSAAVDGVVPVSAAVDATEPVSPPNDAVLYKLASESGTPVATPNDGRVYKGTSEAGGPVATSLVRGVSYLYLQGSVHGTPTTVVGNPDVGTTVKLQGKGNLLNLGSVKVAGSLHGTGFIASSKGIEGSLKLSNGKGSVTLHLQGPPVHGFTAPASGTYTFTITGGTGAYQHTIGNGTVDLVLGAKSFTLNFHGKPNVY